MNTLNHLITIGATICALGVICFALGAIAAVVVTIVGASKYNPKDNE